MTSKSNNKESEQSPAAQRKLRKTNKVNLHAEQNDKITIVGISPSAGGLKALGQFFAALLSSTGMADARDLFYGLFNANPIPAALTRAEDDVFINVNIAIR